jgi:hypothetical protein
MPLARGGDVFDGGGKVWDLTVMGKKNKTAGSRPVKLMSAPLSHLAIERNAFRIPPADGTWNGSNPYYDDLSRYNR